MTGPLASTPRPIEKATNIECRSPPFMATDGAPMAIKAKTASIVSNMVSVANNDQNSPPMRTRGASAAVFPASGPSSPAGRSTGQRTTGPRLAKPNGGRGDGHRC